MSCLLGDAGIAVGLTSLPFRQERQFYQNEIADALFPNYRNAVLSNFDQAASGGIASSEFRHYFYQPVPYYLFGSFDLAVIALVDDFEMMARTFRPFDPMLSSEQDKPYRENFFYRVITGPTPQFRQDDSIVRIAKDTFLREDRAPLLVMSLLKLNNALLLGTGTDFLRPVVRFIHSIAKRQITNSHDLRVILLESYSANEITLLVFTNNYASAAQLISSVRETRVRDLINAGDEVLLPENSAFLLNNCLLNNLGGTWADESKLSAATLFADTESYFGFDFRLLDPSRRALLDRIDPADKLDLFCQWTVRPGHLQHSIKEISTNNTEVSGCVGRGDVIEQSRGLTTKLVIEQVLGTLAVESPPKHARRRQTMPALAGSVITALALYADTGLEYEEPDLSPMTFSVKEIKEIQDSLRAVWAPKILTGKILNAFTNFNDGILDPALYGYFVELLPLMELIQQTVNEWYRQPQHADLGVICGTIEKITDNFERAYRNRFYNSYRMGDITDFNLDFKGGVQQLLTSFDAAYKAIASVLGRPESFAYVAGSPGVYSTRYEVRLNYYHVFQPEIFGCIANHEAANFYLSRPSHKEVPWFARASGMERTVGSAERGASVLNRLADIKRTANADRQVLLRQVTPTLFNYVFVDLLALYFGYNKNGRLFQHWYWGYFAQNSIAYAKSGVLDEIKLVGFMLRMLWIERLSGIQPSDPISFGIDAFDRLTREWRPILEGFLSWLWKDDEVNRWNREVIEHVENKFLSVYRLAGDESVDGIREQIEKQAGSLKQKLQRGEVCQYSQLETDSSFKFTEQLFYAYLSLLADRFGAGAILLDRPEDGRPRINPSNAKALFDPIGGIFTHDADTRRERFRYRAGLTMSLWDMAQKEKKTLVMKRLLRSRQ